MVGPPGPSILKEIALLLCKNGKKILSSLAYTYIDVHNVSVLSVYCRLYIVPYHK